MNVTQEAITIHEMLDANTGRAPSEDKDVNILLHKIESLHVSCIKIILMCKWPPNIPPKLPTYSPIVNL